MKKIRIWSKHIEMTVFCDLAPREGIKVIINLKIKKYLSLRARERESEREREREREREKGRSVNGKIPLSLCTSISGINKYY